MKEKLIAFVLAGMMVLSLAGCGEKKDPTGSPGSNSDVTQDGGSGDAGSGAGGAAGDNAKTRTWDSDTRSGVQGNNSFDNNHGSTFGGIEQDDTVYDDMTGYRTDRTATWQQMLENGRVHDTDGFLLDGENTTW